MEAISFLKLSTENPPEPRFCCAGVYVREYNSIFIHGGTGINSDLKDFYSFDLETSKWYKRGATPECLTGHAAVEIDSRILMFGGWNEQEYTNSCILYDPEDSSLRKGNDQNMMDEWNLPAQRRDHSFTKAKDCIYLLGGWDSFKWNNTNTNPKNNINQITYTQLWKLTDLWKWQVCEVFGEPPMSRRGHSMTYFAEQDYLAVFGGIYGFSRLLDDLYIFNISQMMWVKINANNSPSKRAWHSAACLDSKMYIFGGVTENNGISNELFSYSILENMWEKYEINSLPSPRCGHISLAIEGFIIIFGGKTTHDVPLNEVYVLNFNRNYEEYITRVSNAQIKQELHDLKIVPPPIPIGLTMSRYYKPKISFNPNNF